MKKRIFGIILLVGALYAAADAGPRYLDARKVAANFQQQINDEAKNAASGSPLMSGVETAASNATSVALMRVEEQMREDLIELGIGFVAMVGGIWLLVGSLRKKVTATA